MKIVVAVTGASGFPIAVRLLKELKGNEIHLVVSDHAWDVLKYEECGSREDVTALATRVYDPNEIHTSICSGSFPVDAMVVVPCSMNTLGHIANGIEHNAITRAVGVNLKQERKVILVPRDTPLSLPALRNMVKAKEAGCSIVPPMLCYYTKPKTIDDLTGYTVGKILEMLGIGHELYERWDK
ncbi:MAG: UbiX family flavin prenyltransferase [Candidatus Diapherotrites archaeon]|nr:UbiX family flavin prenyltransferase [Candidatus Diapherotrites archaeon]